MSTPRKATAYIIIHREEVDQWAQEYNAMVDFDGTVRISDVFGIEGKAAHAKDFNGVSVGVAFRGCFATAYNAVHNKPTKEQWEQGLLFIRGLMWWYGLSATQVRGHTEMGPTATRDLQKLKPEYSCPGENFSMDAFRAALG